MRRPALCRFRRWLPLVSMALVLALWPTPGGVLLVLGAGLAVQVRLARCADRRCNDPNDADARADVPPHIRDWRSPAPSHAALYGHAGQGDRVLGRGFGEIGMGGPGFWTLLLRDGAVLPEVCSAAPLDLQEGRLRVVQARAGRGHTRALRVYDRAAQCVHALDAGEVNGLSLPDWWALAQADPAAASVHLRAACAQAAQTGHPATPLHRVHGLRVSRVRFPAPPAPLLTRLLPGGPCLQARLCLPADLRGAAEPLALLELPPYALFLDGQPSGLHVTDLDSVQAHPHGHCALRGVQLDADGLPHHSLWHVWAHGAWWHIDTVAWEPGPGGRAWALHLSDLDDEARTLHLALHDFSGGAADVAPTTPLQLAVSWRPVPLQLAPVGGQLRLRLRLPLPLGQRG